jgi:hypothetical protein
MVAVFHEGAIAHYNVSQLRGGAFTVRLLKYSGQEEYTPPRVFHLKKENGRWIDDDDADRELRTELGYAIDLQQRDFDGPIYNSDGRDRSRGDSGGQLHP